MDYPLRKVVQIPLTELWTDSGSITCIRGGWLTTEAIISLLQHGNVSFVVADVGKKLRWIAEAESHRFWNEEAKPHLAEPDSRIDISEFPRLYCYSASEWTRESGSPIVVLEKHH